MSIMDNRRLFHYVLVGLLLFLLYMGFLLVKPFLTYLVLGVILAYITFPAYCWLREKATAPRSASVLMVFLIILLLVIPSTFLITGLINQTSDAYTRFKSSEFGFDKVFSLPLVNELGFEPRVMADDVAKRVRDYFISQAPDIIGGLAGLLLGLFIMFFMLYYAFVDGERWVQLVKEALPMDKRHKDELFLDVGVITNAVVYGQFLTSVIQGTIGGLMFAIFAIPNPIFWGVIMIILSFIPFLGTPLVWAPVGIFQLVQGHYFSGIGILVIGAILVMNIDNLIKPMLISNKAKLNPLLVLLGVFGGLRLFGFIGILVGPLLLALLVTVIGFFKRDHSAHEHLLKEVKKT